ncbi:hypothetical protein [Kordiimonas sp.]|uniref:hypothetical protein n=1 Tax=Kordiimonas sp. TaxID=1970157 RepID=UPI003A922AAE
MPSDIEYAITNVHLDPPGLTITKWHHALVNIEGDVTLTFGTQQLSLNSITFIELSENLRGWQAGGMDKPFTYDSMNDEDRGLFHIMPEDGLFQFLDREGSCLHTTGYSRTAVESFISEFQDATREAVKASLDINLTLLKP